MNNILRITVRIIKKIIFEQFIILYCKHCKKFKIYFAPYWYGYSVCVRCYKDMLKIL